MVRRIRVGGGQELRQWAIAVVDLAVYRSHIRDPRHAIEQVVVGIEDRSPLLVLDIVAVRSGRDRRRCAVALKTIELRALAQSVIGKRNAFSLIGVGLIDNGQSIELVIVVIVYKVVTRIENASQFRAIAGHIKRLMKSKRGGRGGSHDIWNRSGPSQHVSGETDGSRWVRYRNSLVLSILTGSDGSRGVRGIKIGGVDANLLYIHV